MGKGNPVVAAAIDQVHEQIDKVQHHIDAGASLHMRNTQIDRAIASVDTLKASLKALK